MWNFDQQPGKFFVVATVLPLLAFAINLVWCGLWALAHRHRSIPWVSRLFDLLGGDVSGRVAAVLATTSIGLAFCFSLIGFAFYFQGHDLHYQELEKAHNAICRTFQDLHNAIDNPKKQADLNIQLTEQQNLYQTLQSRWNGHATLLKLESAGQTDPLHGSELNIGYHVDGLAAILFLMVTGIASLVHIYSIGYMKDERAEIVQDQEVTTELGFLQRRGRFGRFFLYLPLFCFAMLNLLIADNLFQVFISWELVGICSYLLIGFYHERDNAASAATKAFLTNQIGDAGFLIGLLILWTYLGTFQFDQMVARLRSPDHDHHGELVLAGRMVRRDIAVPGQPEKPTLLTLMPHKDYKDREMSEIEFQRGSTVVLFPRVIGPDFHGLTPGGSVRVKASPGPSDFGSMPYWALVAAGLGIFLGCVGKSAQFPLHVWLPNAMEGPTPVSALIHAATMVAAGVYLVGRCYPLFTPDVLLVIAYVGAISLFLGASIAMVVTDIKQVLAYSTISQLGYMMLAMGVGGWVAGFFHLITHAIFKSLLFLGAGSVIHGCGGEQDMVRMGGLYPKMRTTAFTMLVGLMALAGVPLFIGWYSKDSVLAHAQGFAWVYPQHSLLLILPLFTAGLTAFYILRLWLLIFTGEPRNQHIADHAHESSAWMTGPLLILAILSLVSAWGWPIWDSQVSFVASFLNQAQPLAVRYDFGHVLEQGELLHAGTEAPVADNVRQVAHAYHHLVGYLALLLVGMGMLFALLIYYFDLFEAAEARRQFPAVTSFLNHRWYFDELYQFAVVHPALRLAAWIRWLDQSVIDRVVNQVAPTTLRVAKLDREFDNRIVDGLVIRIADVFYQTGSRLRFLQTGSLRTYVLFMVMAALGVFFILGYFVTRSMG